MITVRPVVTMEEPVKIMVPSITVTAQVITTVIKALRRNFHAVYSPNLFALICRPWHIPLTYMVQSTAFKEYTIWLDKKWGEIQNDSFFVYELLTNFRSYVNTQCNM